MQDQPQIVQFVPGGTVQQLLFEDFVIITFGVCLSLRLDDSIK